MKQLIILIAIYSCCYYNSNKSNDNQPCGLFQFATKFELEIKKVIVKNGCSNTYSCYGDTLLKLNSGTLITPEMEKVFDDFKSCNLFDSIFRIDSSGYLLYTENSIFIEILKNLSNKNSFYKEYLELFLVFNEIPPSLFSSTNYFIKFQSNFSRDEKNFLFLHFAAQYYMYSG